MKKEKKKKRFLKLPQYPGGNIAFRKFIAENLIYPEEAINNRIEGTVYLSLQINDDGIVLDAKIDKGLGYGCDEEALRLAKMLQYESVRNRGVRVQSRIKIRIRFEPEYKGPEINYNFVSENKKEGTKIPEPQKYEYKIKLE